MALTRALQRAAKRVGAGHIKLHDLRHFHASLLLQSGQSPVLVGKRLGHSSVSMTLDVYGHLVPAGRGKRQRCLPRRWAKEIDRKVGKR